jgi:parallel beta-helix repeat protein
MQTITPRTGDVFIGETGNGTRLTTLSGARVLTGWTFDGARWYVSGQTQQGQVPTPAADACRTTHPRCVLPEDVFFDNVQKFHEGSLAAVGPGEWFFDYAADRIYVGDNPSGHVVETSVTPQLFNPSFADSVSIQDVIVEKYASPSATGAVNLGYSLNGAENWTISGSEVRWNHGAGIALDTKTVARNNYVHHNCGFGFIGAGVGLIVEGNEIAYNNVMAGSTTSTCGYNSYWGAGGSKWVWTTNLVVRGNFSHHNDGPGLWTDINNIYTLYENNTLEDNERGGIFHEISYDATIRNNTARRNGRAKDYPWWTTGAGIEIVSSRNVEVYGNILEDNWQGITGLNDHRGSGNNGPWVLVNLQVHDNNVTSRITDGGGGRTGLVDTVNSDVYLAGSNNRFQRNVYTLGSTLKYFLWMGADRDETEWRAYGQDTTGTFQR